ncbi:MAG: DUF4011 domain-containing protein [Phycisphaerales bacterium]|nr:DUF4011 domain-containing protein [Phycisphaerales bacterium]
MPTDAPHEPGPTEAGAPTPAPPGETPRALRVRIEPQFCPRVNFALQQSRAPVVSAISLTSEEDEVLEDLRVRVSIASGEAPDWEGRIARIGPAETYRLEPVALRLDPSRLAQRTERERTSLVVRVEARGSRAERTEDIDLLPFDHWGGLWPCPELLAAFVTPNHPALAPLLLDVRDVLRSRALPEAIDGYQSGSRSRAVALADACFAAVARRGLAYINPPASFERAGQRVRLADQILREGLGTCLDLSLLLAALWEQAGLNPLILLFDDHALPAFWTHDEHFPEPVVDEPERLRKGVELGELVVVESTLLTHTDRAFAPAVEAAQRRLREAKSVHALDLRTARRLGIRPLPLRAEPTGSTIEPDAIDAPPAEPLPAIALAERADAARTTEPDRPGDRVDRWRRKLLDLTLRNRLLNFRETGRSLGLAVPDLSALEDALADGGSFDLLPKPARGTGEAAPGPEAERAFQLGELEAGRVYTTAPDAETSRRLLELYRSGRSSIEETGANVLFLALGMLHWFEADGAEAPRRAPVILLPITLVRRAVGGGYRYRIELTSEPLRPNITLVEKLRVDFGLDVRGLDEMPEDERGLDVPMILRRFREAIRDAKRWELVESAHLGLFSFNKFLMWHDLQQHRDRLAAQPLVRHLIDRAGPQLDAAPFPSPDALDGELAPGDLLCTRDADSSQLVAVRAAGQGRTFVLEGPPGTGKSQTIANIIADNLARGKRVLFVAEKMAALSVVRRRLEQDGLGPFCLELHSAKASKKEVLRQLGEALDAARAAEPGAWTGAREDLASARDRLNDYVRELHAPRASGESVYQVIGRLAELGEGPRIDLALPAPATVDAEQLAAWRTHIEASARAAEPIDPPGRHPLRGIGRGDWSFSLPEQARAAIDSAAKSLDTLGKSAAAWLTELGLGIAGPSELSHDELRAACSAAAALPACPTPERELLAAPAFEPLAADLRAWIERGRERDRRRAALFAGYRPELLDANLLVLLDSVKQTLARPPIVRWIFAGAARKQIRPYALAQPASLEAIAKDLEEALALTAEQREFTKPGHPGMAAFGRRWNGGEADWDELTRVLAWTESYRQTIAPLASSPRARPLHGALVLGACDPARSPMDRSPLGDRSRELVEAWNGWTGAWKSLRDLLSADAKATWGPGAESAWLQRAGEALRRWRDNLRLLNDWCLWQRERAAAAESGLAPLLEAYEQSRAARADLGAILERSFGERWLVETADASEPIRNFNARAHTEVIDRFRRLDQQLIALTRLTVAARLAERLPGRGVAAASSEVGILERERQKRARHLPTRRLIELLPNLLPRIKPCFLMSPLSVAQYLDPRLPPFDLVVFDEASQIPVWDAIGTIARARDVIVVGDSKQLPPTNFFSTIEGTDEAETSAPEDDELESILQECNASGVPSLRLKWHYRSRHESLITFSNHHYYDDQLQTFPSPLERSDRLGVSFHLIENAVYDRGGSRTNKVEAEAVVAEVLARLAEPDATGSIGIVTFNAQQQGLIEDMLDQARRERPEIERFFTEAEEPVFIKNLENVQGDERDAIIFSVGFGPDDQGRMSMNFGPLNADGGERRLNVAITRARSRLLVFSSMRPDAIDLSRTRALGVQHFRRFLEYAQRGPGAIAEAIAAHREAMTPSPFERSLAEALIRRGWQIDARVGCAGYRIDLGVRDPQTPGRYLLGIECDGPMYAGAATARDRERTRQSVLTGLGWRLTRVWSTAWRLDPEGCLAQIEEEIRNAQEAATTQAQSPPPIPTAAAKLPELPPEGDATPEAPKLGVADSPQAVPVYQIARRPKGVTSNSDIFDERTTERAAHARAAIVEQEAPIVPELALRRLAEWFGVSRITDRYRERFKELLAHAAGSVAGVGDALWPTPADAAGFDGFRTAGGDEASQRDVEWIPLAERAGAVRHALRAQIALPRDDLAREAARLLGVQRATTRTRELMGEAIDDVIAAGTANESDGRVALVS